MYGCESWTVEKAGHQRIDVFELWCWRRLLSSLDLKEIQPVHPKGNQSWLFIGRTLLKLKLQYLGHLMQRTDSLEKTLMLGGVGGRRRRGWQRMRWLDGITDSMDWVWMNSGSWWWTGRPGVLWFMGSQRVGHNWATELKWTELKIYVCVLFSNVAGSIYSSLRIDDCSRFITLLWNLPFLPVWWVWNGVSMWFYFTFSWVITILSILPWVSWSYLFPLM